jgi:hypothetical protein
MAKRNRRAKGKRAGLAPQTNVINADLWQKHINAKLTPAKQQALNRIVVAGMKVMFDKQTHQMMLKELDAPGDIVQKLAEAATRLMIMLFHNSNGSMPQDLIIPAGGVLIAKACEFLNQTGETVTEQQFGQAMASMSKLIVKAASSPNDQAAAPGAPTPAAPNPLNQGATP